MWASNDGPFNILQKLPRQGVELLCLDRNIEESVIGKLLRSYESLPEVAIKSGAVASDFKMLMEVLRYASVNSEFLYGMICSMEAASTNCVDASKNGLKELHGLLMEQVITENTTISTVNNDLDALIRLLWAGQVGEKIVKEYLAKPNGIFMEMEKSRQAGEEIGIFQLFISGKSDVESGEEKINKAWIKCFGDKKHHFITEFI